MGLLWERCQERFRHGASFTQELSGNFVGCIELNVALRTASALLSKAADV